MGLTVAGVSLGSQLPKQGSCSCPFASQSLRETYKEGRTGGPQGQGKAVGEGEDAARPQRPGWGLSEMCWSLGLPSSYSTVSHDSFFGAGASCFNRLELGLDMKNSWCEAFTLAQISHCCDLGLAGRRGRSDVAKITGFALLGPVLALPFPQPTAQPFPSPPLPHSFPPHPSPLLPSLLSGQSPLFLLKLVCVSACMMPF